MRSVPVRGWMLVAAAVLVGLTGCSGAKVTTKVSPDAPRYTVRTLAVLPLTSLATPQAQDSGAPFMVSPEGVRRADMAIAVPPSSEAPLRQTMTVPAYAADKITQLFWTKLRSREGLQVLAPREAAKAAPPAGWGAKPSPEMAAALVATQLKADAALMGQVLVYQERVGSRMGASPAAAVGFEIKVVAADGQVLWVGNYYERQRPMTEDFLGFIQRWAFVTAEELAHYGVNEVLEEFPFGTAGK